MLLTRPRSKMTRSATPGSSSSYTRRIPVTASTAGVVFFLYCSGPPRDLHSFPTRRSSDLACPSATSTPFTTWKDYANYAFAPDGGFESGGSGWSLSGGARAVSGNESYYVHSSTDKTSLSRSEEHTSELQSPDHLVCRLLLE